MTLMERDGQKKRMRVAPSQVEKDEKEGESARFPARALVGLASGAPAAGPLLANRGSSWRPADLGNTGAAVVLFAIPEGRRVSPHSPPHFTAQKRH